MRVIAGRDHKELRFDAAFVPPWTTVPTDVKVTRVKHMNELMTAMWGVHLSMQRPAKADDVVAA